VCDRDVPDAAVSSQRADDEVVLVDDHGEFVGERDAAANSDQGLRLDRLIAVSGQQPGRVQVVPGQEVLGQVGGTAVVGTDPDFVSEVSWVDDRVTGEPVTRGQQDPEGVVEQPTDGQARRNGSGLAVFQAAICLGRLIGDRLVDRSGPSRTFAAGALLAGSGFITGLLINTSGSALAGLALLGLGLATLLPITIGATTAASSLPAPVAVARISTLGYLGSFTGPALIRYLAHHYGLPTALLVPAIAVAATAGTARAVRSSRHQSADQAPTEPHPGAHH
jgi:hypothetical protein